MKLNLNTISLTGELFSFCPNPLGVPLLNAIELWAPGEPTKGKGRVTGQGHRAIYQPQRDHPPDVTLGLGVAGHVQCSTYNNYMTKHITIRHVTFMLSTLTRPRRGGCFCVHFTAEKTEAWGLPDWSPVAP